MNKFQTEGIVIKRVNYGEADRIVTFLTPEHGKVTVMAKGVKRPKSKLAGGIELFSLNDLTILQGKRDISTLISARSKIIYRNILRDIDVVNAGYRAIEFINKGTTDDVEKDYFELLRNSFSMLEQASSDPLVVEAWFSFQFLKLQGNSPELTKDNNQKNLLEGNRYDFLIEDGVFQSTDSGFFESSDIKAWRVLLVSNYKDINRVKGLNEPVHKTIELIRKFADYQL